MVVKGSRWRPRRKSLYVRSRAFSDIDHISASAEFSEPTCGPRYSPSTRRMYSIRKHLRVGCATCSGLFIGRLSALTLHLAAIEVHERILAASGCESTAKPLSKDEARRIAAKGRSCRPSCT